MSTEGDRISGLFPATARRRHAARRAAATIGLGGMLALMACGIRTYMQRCQTPSMPVEIALTAIDGGELNNRDRDLAVSVIRENALRCVRALRSIEADCVAAQAALHFIRNEAK